MPKRKISNTFVSGGTRFAYRFKNLVKHKHRGRGEEENRPLYEAVPLLSIPKKELKSFMLNDADLRRWERANAA